MSRWYFASVMSFFYKRIVRREPTEQLCRAFGDLEHKIHAHAEVRTVDESDSAFLNQLLRLREMRIPSCRSACHRRSGRCGSLDVVDYCARLCESYADICI